MLFSRVRHVRNPCSFFSVYLCSLHSTATSTSTLSLGIEKKKRKKELPNHRSLSSFHKQLRLDIFEYRLSSTQLQLRVFPFDAQDAPLLRSMERRSVFRSPRSVHRSASRSRYFQTFARYTRYRAMWPSYRYRYRLHFPQNRSLLSNPARFTTVKFYRTILRFLYRPLFACQFCQTFFFFFFFSLTRHRNTTLRYDV